MPELLLVHADAAATSVLAPALARAGYRVSAASNYPVARRALEMSPIDVVVADVRLAEYNGIHLAAYAHSHGRIPTVVTHYTPDVSLTRDAMQFGAMFVVDPVRHIELLVETVRQICPPDGTKYQMYREWPRVRVTRPVKVRAAARTAHIVDVSYNGVKLAFDAATDLPTAFDVEVPEADLHVVVQRVWSGGDGPFACGASIVEDSRRDWCAFVDAIR